MLTKEKLLELLKGKTENEAIEIVLNINNYPSLCRVINRKNEAVRYTMDYQPTRVNLMIDENGLVEDIKLG